MGAKKKGANKLARMSEEEKIRYLQHRAAIEEEARRRKEQLISTFMKNKLKREEIFSRLNTAKINQQWRQSLRQIKCVELKQDLEDLFKWFDYTSEKKNRIIEMLLEDLDEAESQYTRIYNCQMETMNKLLKIHGQRLHKFHEQYKRERDEIYRKAKASLNDITESYTIDEDNLEATLYKMEEICEEKVSLMTSKHFSKIDELRNNMLTEMENLKNSRELQIEKLWKEFENVLKHYWEETEDRRRQYLLLRQTDQENCKQIFENNQQINKTIETINNLKEQLAKTQKTAEYKLLECNNNKENTRQLLFSLKKKIDAELESDKRNLNFMNSAAGKTTDELQRILEKGEQILHLQSLCRKLETLDEKICPEGHDKPQLTQEEENAVQEEFQKFVEPLAEAASKDILKLDGFWKRYNRVLLEKEALALHLQSLTTEQKHLKSQLKSYLTSVVVKKPESKVSHANGIQMTKQRPHTSVLSNRKPSSVVTCIEATQSPSIRHLISAQMRNV